ncbi:MAG TPA: phage terminase large subunit [Anaerolineaceae bacterium]|nr:phage terminase large subunit [Anaerolineaceae bacterium]
MMNLPQLLSKKTAALELLNRRAARRGLLNFTNFTFPQYKAEPAHCLMGDTLDQVVSGDILRLMIFAPPQHGKSEIVSVRLPAYWLGKRPEDPVIISSYAAGLAESKSRQVRDIITGEDYQALFPDIHLRRDSRAVDEWHITGKRGYIKAVGVDGPVTGHGGLLGIIDDPIENWAQAQSKVMRDKTWEWYRKTFRTRIWEGGAIILVMTRWHEDDLAGRLLQDQPKEWHVLRLPALAETQTERDENNKRLNQPIGLPDPIGRQPGEPLCPGRYSAKALLSLKHDVGTAGWIAEYQGVPRPNEGSMFKREWFEIIEALPTGCRFLRYWDKAGTQGGGDHTSGVLMAATPDKMYIIVDVVRGQWSAARREAVIKQTAQLDRERFGNVILWVEQEGGSGGKESAENTVINLAGFTVRAEHPTGSKEVRAGPLAAQAEVRNVKLLKGPWNWDYLEELTGFPNGANDDQVDGSSGAFNKLLKPNKARANAA